MLGAVIRARRVIPSVLADVVRKAPLCPEKVSFAWNAAVGASLQRVTTVRLDDEGVLHITAADAHWAREVARSSRVILARLEPLLGPGIVRELRTRNRP
jgi:predicted nucleic acid-binding Zn ribbon protein